jgi:two-component system nitrogen regulation sensor histidine kinase NtrY
VVDNGIGLPETGRERLLEPYMTTREKGTGLGLAIVRKIAEEQGGRIELLDAASTGRNHRGACVRFVLPLADTADRAGESPLLDDGAGARDEGAASADADSAKAGAPAAEASGGRAQVER